MQAANHIAQHITSAQSLIVALENAFAYTRDNNRDLISDSTFSIAEVIEELEVERSYQFLQAYIARNEEMINSNLSND